MTVSLFLWKAIQDESCGFSGPLKAVCLFCSRAEVFDCKIWIFLARRNLQLKSPRIRMVSRFSISRSVPRGGGTDLRVGISVAASSFRATSLPLKLQSTELTYTQVIFSGD